MVWRQSLSSYLYTIDISCRNFLQIGSAASAALAQVIDSEHEVSAGILIAYRKILYPKINFGASP
jgi:hypothetical protein